MQDFCTVLTLMMSNVNCAFVLDKYHLLMNEVYLLLDIHSCELIVFNQRILKFRLLISFYSQIRLDFTMTLPIFS